MAETTMRAPGYGDDLLSFVFSGRARSCDNLKPVCIDSNSNTQITYADLPGLIHDTALGMAALGIHQGDVVMTVMPNCIEYPVIFLGAMRAGAIVTTVNPLNTLKEIHKQAGDSGAKLVFCSSQSSTKLEALGLPMILVGNAKRAQASGTTETTTVGPAVMQGLKKYSFEEFVKSRPCGSSLPSNGAGISSTAAILYSSGTTGVSKGVVLSHGNLIAGLKIIEKAREDQPDNEVVLGVLPFFHIAGLVYVMLSSIYSGTTFIVVEKFNLLDAFKTIERYHVSYMPCVPPIVIAFTKNYDLSKKYDLSSLRLVVCGAAPMGKETQEAFLRLYPHVTSCRQAYGMTETTGVGFGLTKDCVSGSAGKVMPYFEVKIVDVANSNILPPLFQGELCLRGPSIMQGYLNNPKATMETIDKERWLHTGDLVYLDKQGNMFVMDRLKELIKYKGFQVAPAELEAVLLSHPLIKDCCVVPFPDEECGDIPLAYVVRAPDSNLSESEVIKFVSEQVAPHKRVRLVRFMDSIPKSATGKLLRKDLIKLSRSRL